MVTALSRCVALVLVCWAAEGRAGSLRLLCCWHRHDEPLFFELLQAPPRRLDAARIKVAA